MSEVKITIGSPGVVARAEPAPLRPVIDPPIARAITPAQEYGGPYEVTPALVGIVLPTAGRLMTQDVKIAPAPTPGTYMGPYNVTPGASPIVLETAGLQMALDVTVAAAAAGAVYETGPWTPSEDVALGEISFVNPHSSAPILAAVVDTTGKSVAVDNSMYSWLMIDSEGMWGKRMPYSSSSLRGAFYGFSYRASSTATAGGRTNVQASGTAEAGTGYYLTSSKMYPYGNSASRYWRSDRTYSWIAIWKP